FGVDRAAEVEQRLHATIAGRRPQGPHAADADPDEADAARAHGRLERKSVEKLAHRQEKVFAPQYALEKERLALTWTVDSEHSQPRRLQVQFGRQMLFLAAVDAMNDGDERRRRAIGERKMKIAEYGLALPGQGDATVAIPESERFGFDVKIATASIIRDFPLGDRQRAP